MYVHVNIVIGLLVFSTVEALNLGHVYNCYFRGFQVCATILL